MLKSALFSAKEETLKPLVSERDLREEKDKEGKKSGGKEEDEKMKERGSRGWGFG